ncbi:MAG: D-amino-acid transaminase [Candidatus Roizmanbacteria bacterium GW2011_GWC2_37_13]|uniref:D-amino-acid transaminase n=1 Tax=Candidatus Roizmanbacteria bacterium GW2011_GWC2_37_13 TaxID=1618486 RepID=A0A0G0G1V5_9BACT|nr:MAG: D-amino-acid transaminase [Candidatus Roizmanbacteria bacterium GW2011_GWC1_37_12]KKQ25138.1 MAG: D-amino-acid transaminase [Candidatus Roizmanbacteria bacterium GW2011_GWC2_37_13]
MDFKYFSYNGQVLPIDQAVIPLTSKEYTYGFGVYETIRIKNGIPYFLKEHAKRLIESARIIELEHPFSLSFVENSVLDLIKKIGPMTINLKVLLLGAPIKEKASLYLVCLNPLFPDRKLYKHGADFITFNYERVLPNSKSLNMLFSYIAYTKARRLGSYDALLINRHGFITEGTMTNFYCIKDKTIYTPFEKDILLGVTMDAVFMVARKNSYKIIEKNISLKDVSSYDGAFITSTSSKIIPVRSIDGKIYNYPEKLKKLMSLFDEFLKNCGGKMR